MLEKSLYESGRFQELERILNRLIQRYSDQPSLYLALASLYEKKGERDSAIRLIEDEKGLLSDHPPAGIRLASLFLQKGDSESALGTLQSIGIREKKDIIYCCSSCGNISAAPLTYCDNCSTFDSFTRSYEEISD